MRFVRVTYHKSTREVLAVFEQDTPFTYGGTLAGEHAEAIDLGVAEDQDWSDLAGQPCNAASHIHERLRAGLPHGVARVHDCPCTLAGIRDRLRARGPAGIPVKVRAWLATVLPEHQTTAMGLWRGLPVSALKAAEALRNRRDPHGGSRLEHLTGIAQRQSDALAGARLRKRQRRPA